MVARPQMLDDRHAVGFLADARVRGAVQHAFLEQRQQRFLESANEAHATVETLVTGIVRRAGQSGIRVADGIRLGAGGWRSVDGSC